MTSARRSPVRLAVGWRVGSGVVWTVAVGGRCSLGHRRRNFGAGMGGDQVGFVVPRRDDLGQLICVFVARVVVICCHVAVLLSAPGQRAVAAWALASGRVAGVGGPLGALAVVFCSAVTIVCCALYAGLGFVLIMVSVLCAGLLNSGFVAGPAPAGPRLPRA